MGVPNPVDGALQAMLIIGVVIGLAVAGLIWLAVWLFSHIDIKVLS